MSCATLVDFLREHFHCGSHHVAERRICSGDGVGFVNACHTFPMLKIGIAFAFLLFLAGSGSAEIRLDCPEHTRPEERPLHKRIEVHCTLGDGTRQGPWGGWFPSGQRAVAGYYENGRLHGTETEWYDATELSGWQGFRARFRLPRRHQKEWSRGKLHGEVIEWDIRGRVLQRSTWHRGEFVGYTHPRGSAAKDAQLGRPFATRRKPKGCFAREYYPSLLRVMMGEPTDGYSGYEVLYGTNKDCRREELPCRSYSHAELSDIMGREIDGYATSARFAVVSCRTGEDQRRHTAVAELMWRKQSAVYRDPGVIALLSDMHGVWCGRSTRIQHNFESNREIRIEFIQGDPERAALATDTWNRVPGGPVGEPGYVMSSLLIPMPRSGVDSSPAINGQDLSPTTTMHFKAVSVHANVGGYALSKDPEGFVIKHGGRAYPMSQDCEGFWVPPDPDLSAYDTAPGQDEAP